MTWMEVSLFLGINFELEGKGVGTKLLPEKLWGIKVLIGKMPVGELQMVGKYRILEAKERLVSKVSWFALLFGCQDAHCQYAQHSWCYFLSLVFFILFSYFILSFFFFFETDT